MIKVAILIDGGYFLKRLPAVRPDVDSTDPEEAVKSVWQLRRISRRSIAAHYGQQILDVHNLNRSRLVNPRSVFFSTGTFVVCGLAGAAPASR